MTASAIAATPAAGHRSDDLLVATNCTKRFGGLLAVNSVDFTIPRGGIDNQIMVLRGLRGNPELEVFHQPSGGRFVGDLTLHFDATRLMFSSIGANGR